MPFLQWSGQQEAGSKNWYVSVALTVRSVDSIPFWMVTSMSKK